MDKGNSGNRGGWVRIKRLLVQGITERVFPGAVLKVLKDSQVVFDYAIGVTSLSPIGRKISLDTVFDVASLTKIIATTSTVMLLLQDKKLNLDSEFLTYIPGIRSPDKKHISIRQLLSHSSGLNAWKPVFKEIEDEEKRTGVKILETPNARQFFLKTILNDPLLYKPGTRSLYSDLGFILLGFVIENVTGEALDDFVSKNIFDPLGMKTSFFMRHFEKIKRFKRLSIAATERCPWRERVIIGEVHDENAWAMGGVAGHAGLFSNAKDIAIFAREIIQSYYGKGKLFQKNVAREFFKKQNLPSSTFALGWDTPTMGSSSSGRYFSNQSIGHTGFTGCSLWIDLKRRVAVILLTNRIHPDRSNLKIKEFRPHIHDAVMEALGYGSSF